MRWMVGRVMSCVLALASAARAEPRLEVGAYGGGTATTMHETISCPPPKTDDFCVSGLDANQGAHGVSFGAYLRWPILRAVELEADLMYAQKGYDVSPKVRMHYLEAPILVRIDPFRGWSHARVFGYAGIAPALHLSCRESGTLFDNTTHSTAPYSDACGSHAFDPRSPNRLDLGGVVGAGLGWEFSIGVVEIQVRYVAGLVDNGAWSQGGKTVNEAFSVLAGFGRTLGTP